MLLIINLCLFSGSYLLQEWLANSLESYYKKFEILPSSIGNFLLWMYISPFLSWFHVGEKCSLFIIFDFLGILEKI